MDEANAMYAMNPVNAGIIIYTLDAYKINHKDYCNYNYDHSNNERYYYHYIIMLPTYN